MTGGVPLLAGLRVPAGLGHATVMPDIDFETYSEAGYVWNDEKQRWDGPPGAPANKKGLPVVGAEPYAKHPTCRIVWAAYDLKDGRGRRRWRPGLPAPQDLFDHVRAGKPLEAWSVGFERWIWEYVCVPRLGWPPVAEEQWFCAMAKARAFALPGKLELAGQVLNLSIQKDPRGAALMKRLSMPVKPTQGDPRRSILPVYSNVHQQLEAYRVLAHIVTTNPPKTARSIASAVDKAAASAQRDRDDTEAYGQYNETDIASEAEASLRIPDLEGEELAWWRAHERINRRGVHIDRVGIENCIAIVEQAFKRYNTELLALTGVDAASKVEQLQTWLRARGVHLDSLDEEAVESALKNPAVQGAVRRVLEIRAAVGSASIKKLFAMRCRASDDDRLRDLYVYFGARTGRSTGEGPQPTNVKRAGPDMVRCSCGKHYGRHRLTCPWCGALRPAGAKLVEWNPEIAEEALAVAALRSLEVFEAYYGDALPTLGGCLRALYDAAPGRDLISTDFSSIEAVGLAMVSGEAWRIKVFRTHGKIYEASASTMFGVPLEEILSPPGGGKHPLRQKGKIGELAFGYQGWLGAAKAFEMPGTDDEIKADILRWRAASPAIEWLWGGQTLGKAWSIVKNASAPGYEGATDTRVVADVAAAQDGWDRSEYFFGVEGMALLAMKMPERWFDVARLDGTHSGVSFMRRGSILYCRLPSGRLLHYHNPVVVQGDRGESLSYEGYNTNTKNGPVGWIRMNTWGGRLVENIIQATCREVLRRAVLALEAAGYPVVLHVYDEIVAEVPEGFGSVEEFESIVTRAIEFLPDWPIRAPGGYRAKRYRKG